jgi:NAD-reducing hydrogenase large subunit
MASEASNSKPPPPKPVQLRRVAIDPVSRVEGHGKVTLLLDDNDKVQQVRLHIVEFRGFEKFIQGRPYWEVPVMVQRLCGICPVSHHLAAAKALDHVVGAEQLTASAEKLRRLMHYGQILQSHALHFFHLSSPDLLFGFASDAGRRNIVGVAAAYPEVAKQGVLLRKFGQEVIRLTAGKRVHGTGAIPGGVNRALSRGARRPAQADIYQMVAWSRDAVAHHPRPVRCRRTSPLYNAFGRFRSAGMCLVRADGAMDLYDGGLRARDIDGKILFDHFDYDNYQLLGCHRGRQALVLHEVSLLQVAGSPRTAPTASVRCRACDVRPHPDAAGRQGARGVPRLDGGSAAGATLGYHWARMIEMLHAAETIKDLLHDDDIIGHELMATGDRQERGVGVIEAPRGTLIHHYRVDDERPGDPRQPDRLHHAQQPGDEHGGARSRPAIPRRRELTEGLLNHIEVAIRAFDPCLSCATHALGKMPLEVAIVGADGTVIDSVMRNASTACRRTPVLTAPTLIFGWGNPSRGDDALGPLFVEHFTELAARHPEWGEH